MTRDEWMQQKMAALDELQAADARRHGDGDRSAWAWDCARELMPDLYEIGDLRGVTMESVDHLHGPVLSVRNADRKVTMLFEQEDGPGNGHRLLVTAIHTGMTWRASMRDKHMVTTALRTATDFLTKAASRSQWKRIVFQRTRPSGEAG